MNNITRQIDTGIGLIVGGVVGWYHHDWGIWLLLFLILFGWHYLEKAKKEKYEKEKQKNN